MLVYGGWASAAICAHQVVVPHEHRAEGRRQALQNEIFLKLVARNQAEMVVGESLLVFAHRGSA